MSFPNSDFWHNVREENCYENPVQSLFTILVCWLTVSIKRNEVNGTDNTCTTKIKFNKDRKLGNRVFETLQ
jgi:hypothetical protein